MMLKRCPSRRRRGIRFAVPLCLIAAAMASAQATEKQDERWEPPTPPGAAERVEEREAMVRSQIAEPRDGREIVEDEATLDAMRATPRHAFVPEAYAERAHDDTPLPIGSGQTISQPYMVAFMTEQLDLEPHEKVLEIGTGSGYQAAVLAHFTPHVYSVEIVEELHERAAKALEEQKYDDVHLKHGDGYYGWEEHGPYDAIIVTCAAGHLPPPLWQQLKPGGRIIIPLGGPWETQRLVRITKTEEGKRRSESLMAVRFVPMTGDAQKK